MFVSDDDDVALGVLGPVMEAVHTRRPPTEGDWTLTSVSELPTNPTDRKVTLVYMSFLSSQGTRDTGS